MRIARHNSGTLLLIFGTALAIVVLVADLTQPSLASVAHSHGTVTPTHSPISIAFAFAGPAIVLAGLVINYPGSFRSVPEAGLVAGLTLLYVDGLLHWLAVLSHLGETLSASFFIASGALQVGTVLLVVAFRKQRESLLWWTGVALTVFFIELYLIAVFVAAPFSLRPEPTEVLATLSKIVEFATIASLTVYFGPRVLPLSLRSAMVKRTPLALLFLGVLINLATLNIEGNLYWWILTPSSFLVAASMLIGLTSFASIAYYLRTAILVSMTWIFVAMVIILHLVYAINYVTFANMPLPISLIIPLPLCIMSASLPFASMIIGVIGHSNPKVL